LNLQASPEKVSTPRSDLEPKITANGLKIISAQKLISDGHHASSDFQIDEVLKELEKIKKKHNEVDLKFQ
jgi:hypothetical protein